jgi:peptidoglycan/LPS O-acetylase OafA/YrhL
MSATTAAITTTHRSERSTSSLRRTTVVAGLAGAAVTTTAAAVLHAAGIPFAIDGEMIPLAGFAQMVVLGAVLGGLLAAVLKRRSTTPRRRFLQTTVALTALSCVPSVALPPDVATKLALVLTHVIAATIIVPALARQLDD